MSKKKDKAVFDKILDAVGSFQRAIPEDEDPYYVERTTVWWSYPLMIKWKINQRNKMNQDEMHNLITGINTSMIVDCASFVEGVMDEIIREVLYNKSFPYKDAFKERMIRDLESKSENAQWTEYIRLIELVAGKNLKQHVGNEMWKSVSALFTFRNMIVHGKEIEVEYYKVNEKRIKILVPKKYHGIYSYLVERKTINNKIKDQYQRIDLLSNEVADHFYQVAVNYTTKVVKIFPIAERKNVEERILDSISFEEV